MNSVKITKGNTNTNSVWKEIFDVVEKKYEYLIKGREGEKENEL